MFKLLKQICQEYLNKANISAWMTTIHSGSYSGCFIALISLQSTYVDSLETHQYKANFNSLQAEVFHLVF